MKLHKLQCRRLATPLLAAWLILATAATSLAVPAPGTARSAPPASCAQQQEDGSWVNTDPNTSGITRIKLRFVCQDQVHNGEPYPPGPPWYMHLYGKCHPTDCDWNEVGARRVGGNYVYAFYDQGFARRYAYARMSQYRPGQLWLFIKTDFVDPNRADYESQHWFTRQ